MIGNVKAIILSDGKEVSLEDRIGEYFQIEVEPNFFNMVHQKVFFKDYVGDEALLVMLLEREDYIKRREAGKKAAVTRKKNRELASESKEAEVVKKEPSVTKETPEINTSKDSVTEETETEEVDESGEFERAAAEAEEKEQEAIQAEIEERLEVHTEESQEDLTAKIPAELKEVVDASHNLTVVSPKEAFKPLTDEEIAEDQAKLEVITDAIIEKQTEAVEAAAPPKFEKPSLVELQEMLTELKFANSADKGSLFISTTNTEDFIQKMAEYSGAETIDQMNLFPNILEFYPTIKEKDVKSVCADVTLLLAPPAKQYGLAKTIMLAMEDSQKLFFVHANKTKAGELKDLPNFNEFQEALLHSGCIVKTASSDLMTAMCISNE